MWRRLSNKYSNGQFNPSHRPASYRPVSFVRAPKRTTQFNPSPSDDAPPNPLITPRNEYCFSIVWYRVEYFGHALIIFSYLQVKSKYEVHVTL